MLYPSCIHTHTQFCDGKSAMSEIARRARELGFLSLGFSPHSPLPYDNDWSMRDSDYPAFFAEISSLKKLYAGKTEIFSGVEWDADTPSVPEGFDYVIGAVHSLVKNGVRFSVDYEKSLLRSVTNDLYGGSFLDLCADYFDAVAKAALRPRVDVVAHFDLVTKYNRTGEFVNENDPAYLALAEKALDFIFARRSDLYFEINTGVIARAGKPFPYPSPAILRMMRDRGARFILSCDCHRVAQLGVGYDVALNLLSALPGAKLYIFTSEGFIPFDA